MHKLIAIAAAFLTTSLAGAAAEVYPARPITVVVPYPAGGPTDTLARILADHMRTSLGQSVIVENVTGGGGSIGVGRVARAAADGYTLSIGHWNTHVVHGATLNLPFHVLNDFEPVALLADTPIWLVARKALPPKRSRQNHQSGYVATPGSKHQQKKCGQHREYGHKPELAGPQNQRPTEEFLKARLVWPEDIA
jgi:tripartite-type tricarboxylate transporter receptor subunit TctC